MSEPNIVLHLVTDNEGPEWVQAYVKRLATMASSMGARMASARGTSALDDHAWVFVITVVKAQDRWQGHASWFDFEGRAHEAAYGVEIDGGSDHGWWQRCPECDEEVHVEDWDRHRERRHKPSAPETEGGGR